MADSQHADHCECKSKSIILEMLIETRTAKLLDTRREKVQEGGSDNDA